MLNITGLDGPHISRGAKMAEVKFKVLKGQKYLGRHKIYKEGEEFPGSELFGNEDNHRMAVEGGGINDTEPRIEVVKPAKQGKKKEAGKKDDEKKDKK